MTAQNILSKDTVIPISFAILLLGYATISERRITKMETLTMVHQKDKHVHLSQSELRQYFAPKSEIELELDVISDRLGRIEKKLKIN